MNSEHPNGRLPIVIAGGGPVGVSLALELALHGVPSTVLEQRSLGEVWQCRSNFTNVRSMELFRRWGIADALRANDPVAAHVMRSVTWATALNGHLVADFENVFHLDEPLPFASETPEWAPNSGIELTMQAAAAANPLIDIRFAAELTAFTQTSDTVAIDYIDMDGPHELKASYLVGADGSRSLVRQQLGVRLEGHPDLAEASIWLIEAQGLTERSTVGVSSFYFFINEHKDSTFLIMQDDQDHYTFGIVPISAGMDAASWDDALTVLHRNLGFDFPVKCLSGGRVRIHSLIASRFDHGRVLLAGDAAHLISPMGGFGMNIGIGDAVDLGWKLAATVKGWAGPRLLESYGQERASAERWIQDECIDNTGTLAPQLVEDGIAADGPDGDQVRARVGARIVALKSKEFNSIGAQLGYRYDSSPIIFHDGTPPPALSMGEYVPSARPGALAPHLWLAPGDSLYDHFGVDFTLLVIDGDPGADPLDTTPLADAAAERGVPLDVVVLNDPRLRDLYEARLTLIRPDQHVAWRSDWVPTDPATIIDVVRGA